MFFESNMKVITIRHLIRPDNNITEILKADREKGFRLLVEKYSSRLYWHIRRLVILHEDADDAFQNTFINAWRTWAISETKVHCIHGCIQ